jgi:hypothetical protein
MTGLCILTSIKIELNPPILTKSDHSTTLRSATQEGGQRSSQPISLKSTWLEIRSAGESGTSHMTNDQVMRQTASSTTSHNLVMGQRSSSLPICILCMTDTTQLNQKSLAFMIAGKQTSTLFRAMLTSQFRNRKLSRLSKASRSVETSALGIRTVSTLYIEL